MFYSPDVGSEEDCFINQTDFSVTIDSSYTTEDRLYHISISEIELEEEKSKKSVKFGKVLTDSELDYIKNSNQLAIKKTNQVNGLISMFENSNNEYDNLELQNVNGGDAANYKDKDPHFESMSKNRQGQNTYEDSDVLFYSKDDPDFFSLNRNNDQDMIMKTEIRNFNLSSEDSAYRESESISPTFSDNKKTLDYRTQNKRLKNQNEQLLLLIGSLKESNKHYKLSGKGLRKDYVCLHARQHKFREENLKLSLKIAEQSKLIKFLQGEKEILKTMQGASDSDKNTLESELVATQTSLDNFNKYKSLIDRYQKKELFLQNITTEFLKKLMYVYESVIFPALFLADNSNDNFEFLSFQKDELQNLMDLNKNLFEKIYEIIYSNVLTGADEEEYQHKNTEAKIVNDCLEFLQVLNVKISMKLGSLICA